MTEFGNRKIILDIFEQSLCENYHAYCSKHEMEATQTGLLAYLIDRELFPQKVVRDYAIKVLYLRLVSTTPKGKTLLVEQIADRFNLSQRTVWNALRDVKETI